MKRFLATTAIVALAAAPVMADSHLANEKGMNANTSAEMSQGHADKATSSNASARVGGMDLRASDLIGQPVYIRNAAGAAQEIADTVSQPADNWERAGEIGDVILTKDGKIDAVILDVGGFLGMGEKHVSTDMDKLKFVSSKSGKNAKADARQEFFVVFTGNRSMLEARDEVDEQSVRDSGNSFWSDASDQGKPTASHNADMSGQGNQSIGLTANQRGALTAEDLQGLSVYGIDDESIGEISDLIMSDGGEISKVIIDVGGFLGIGEKSVAIPFEEITLREGGDDLGDKLRATIEYSGDELKSMQEWEG